MENYSFMKKREKHYHLSIKYFLIFTFFTFSSGSTLFFVENGFSPKLKSFETIIEIFTPHVMAMGLTIFVVAHFLLFSTRYKQQFLEKIFIILVFLMLLEESGYLLMSIGGEFFSMIKVLLLLLYSIAFIAMLWVVLMSL